MWSARVVGAGCLALALVAGCGGSDEASTTSAPDVTQAATSTAEATPAPAKVNVLGVTMTTATAGRPGAVVQSIPADTKSQLRTGDVVVAYNGDPVATAEKLAKVVAAAQLGQGFQITVIRGSHRLTLTEVPTATTYLGVKAKDAGGGDGALVAAVAPGSPAEKADLRKGDVITAIDDERVRATSDLLTAVGTRHPGDRVTVAYTRGSDELKTKAVLTTRPEP